MNSQLHRACRQFARFLVHQPRLVLGLLAMSAIAGIALAPGVQFDFSPQAIYRTNDDLVSFSEDFKSTFGYDEAIVLVVLEATGERDVFDQGALQWQRDIVADFRSLPRVHAVESLITIQTPRLKLSGTELSSFFESRRIDAAAAEAARGLFASQPLARSGLLSDDDRAAGIPVFLDDNARDISSMQLAVGAIRKAVASRPAPDGYRVSFTGLPVLRVEVVRDIGADQMTLIPLASLVYLGVLGVMFRRVSGALLPLVAVGIGLSWTVATFAVTHQSLNLVTNVLPILLLIIGVSSSVQIVSCYAEDATAAAGDLRTAVIQTITRMTPACLLAALTTAVGFASLATAHSVLLRSFGWQAAIGVGYQYVCTLIFLGSVLRFFAPPKTGWHAAADRGFTTRTVTAAGFAVARHPWLTLVGAAAIVAGAACIGSRVQINSFSDVETFSENHPAVQALRLVEHKLGGIMPLEISLQADRPGQFVEPEIFHKVVTIEEAARTMPGVLSAQSYADLFREVLAHWPGRRVSESDEELVPSGATGLNRLLRTDHFMQRFADAFHYYSFLSADGTRARVRLRLRELGSIKTLALLKDLEAQLAEVFPPGGPIQARLTGEACVEARALTTLIHDLFYSLLTASLVIFGLIAIEFRSLRAGLVAALPNLTPLVITLGYMGLRGYEMNVANVIVFTICLGLADDNTIHFLYRFREELEADGNVAAAIQRSFQGTGRAIVATSLMLGAGMLVLMLSNFVPTRRFGELTCVTIIGNLLGVLLLLPACLSLAWKSPVSHEAAPSDQAPGD